MFYLQLVAVKWMIIENPPDTVEGFVIQETHLLINGNTALNSDQDAPAYARGL